jgi:integrase/recombinase XerD
MTTPSATKIITFPEAEIGIIQAYIRGLPSPTTRRIYAQIIRAFETFVGVDVLSVTRRQVEAYRAHLEDQHRAAATVGKHLSAINGLFDYALAEGLVDRNPVATARRPKISDVSPRRALSPAEVRALLAIPDVTTMVGLRDRALLTVLAVQGWRISEALGLRVEDLDEEQGQRVATIHGKGGNVARVPLAGPAWVTIKTWIDASGIASGPIFVAVVKGGRVESGRSISIQSAWKRIRHLAKAAGITRAVHPHLFRHAAVTQALAAGVALHEVQDFARHADPRTTRRYDSHRASLSNRSPHVLAALLVDGGK